MIIDMFVHRMLNLMSLKLTSHSRYEMLEIDLHGAEAVKAYEAIVMGTIL
jgi:hypothetical protein